MKIRFVADVHIGNHKQFGGAVTSGINARCRQVLDGLKLAAQSGDPLVVLGDLFDTSSPSPQMIAATMDALSHSSTYLLLGNHDMVSDAYDDHALAPLERLPRCKVYAQPGIVKVSFDQFALLMVPFRPEPMVDWFAETVGNLLMESALAFGTNTQGNLLGNRILCFHGGVRDHNTPKYLWSSPDAIDIDLLFDVMKRANVRWAVCGNWHNQRVWQRDGMTVVQVGALVPTGFDNAGWDYGGVVDIDTSAGDIVVQKLPTIRFLAMTAKEIRGQDKRLRNYDGGIYLKVKLQPGQTQEEAAAIVDQYAVHHGGDDAPKNILGVVYAAAEEDTAQQEMEAAEAARTADTLEGALREYVQAMPLPDGVERTVVETKVLNYIARE